MAHHTKKVVGSFSTEQEAMDKINWLQNEGYRSEELALIKNSNGEIESIQDTSKEKGLLEGLTNRSFISLSKNDGVATTLMSTGTPKDDAYRYEYDVKAGKVLVLAETDVDLSERKPAETLSRMDVYHTEPAMELEAEEKPVEEATSSKINRPLTDDNIDINTPLHEQFEVAGSIVHPESAETYAEDDRLGAKLYEEPEVDQKTSDQDYTPENSTSIEENGTNQDVHNALLFEHGQPFDMEKKEEKEHDPRLLKPLEERRKIKDTNAFTSEEPVVENDKSQSFPHSKKFMENEYSLDEDKLKEDTTVDYSDNTVHSMDRDDRHTLRDENIEPLRTSEEKLEDDTTVDYSDKTVHSIDRNDRHTLRDENIEPLRTSEEKLEDDTTMDYSDRKVHRMNQDDRHTLPDENIEPLRTSEEKMVKDSELTSASGMVESSILKQEKEPLFEPGEDADFHRRSTNEDLSASSLDVEPSIVDEEPLFELEEDANIDNEPYDESTSGKPLDVEPSIVENEPLLEEEGEPVQERSLFGEKVSTSSTEDKRPLFMQEQTATSEENLYEDNLLDEEPTLFKEEDAALHMTEQERAQAEMLLEDDEPLISNEPVDSYNSELLETDHQPSAKSGLFSEEDTVLDHEQEGPLYSANDGEEESLFEEEAPLTSKKKDKSPASKTRLFSDDNEDPFRK